MSIIFLSKGVRGDSVTTKWFSSFLRHIFVRWQSSQFFTKIIKSLPGESFFHSSYFLMILRCRWLFPLWNWSKIKGISSFSGGYAIFWQTFHLTYFSEKMRHNITRMGNLRLFSTQIISPGKIVTVSDVSFVLDWKLTHSVRWLIWMRGSFY